VCVALQIQFSCFLHVELAEFQVVLHVRLALFQVVLAFQLAVFQVTGLCISTAALHCW